MSMMLKLRAPDELPDRATLKPEEQYNRYGVFQVQSKDEKIEMSQSY